MNKKQHKGTASQAGASETSFLTNMPEKRMVCTYQNLYLPRNDSLAAFSKMPLKHGTAGITQGTTASGSTVYATIDWGL